MSFQQRVLGMRVGRCSSLWDKFDVRTDFSHNDKGEVYTCIDTHSNSESDWYEIATHGEVRGGSAAGGKGKFGEV